MLRQMPLHLDVHKNPWHTKTQFFSCYDYKNVNYIDNPVSSLFYARKMHFARGINFCAMFL